MHCQTIHKITVFGKEKTFQSGIERYSLTAKEQQAVKKNRISQMASDDWDRNYENKTNLKNKKTKQSLNLCIYLHPADWSPNKVANFALLEKEKHRISQPKNNTLNMSVFYTRTATKMKINQFDIPTWISKRYMYVD